MKFRTEVDIPFSDKEIQIEDGVFTIGSCFASEIAEKLSKGQLKTMDNPFGTLFNPYSINEAIKKIHDAYVYTEDDLICYDSEYISLDHHTSFNRRYPHQALEGINDSLQKANQFLQKAKWVIITYGSSFIYEFTPKNRLVANCHKIPQKFFNKRMLLDGELVMSISNTIEAIRDIAPAGVQILLTISPVRHTREGMVENMWSKARLINAVHGATLGRQDVTYLPIYELMMDDLRDYRFYKEDMIHPSPQAVNYIFEKFGSAYFSDETKDFITENYKILQALNHKTDDEKDPRYVAFREKVNQKIAQQQAKVKHKIFADYL